MKKIIVELLEQYEKEAGMPQHELTFYTDEQIISKQYGFIKWLVDNDKIDKVPLSKEFRLQINLEDNGSCWGELGGEDRILMLLAISDTPIDDLISYLK